AARNSEGTVFLFADKMTAAMQAAIDETQRRRKIQVDYNMLHGITPQTIIKAITSIGGEGGPVKEYDLKKVKVSEVPRLIEELLLKMDIATQNLEFEKAAEYRDELAELEKLLKK